MHSGHVRPELYVYLSGNVTFMSKLKRSTAFWKYVQIFSGFKVESGFLKIFEFLWISTACCLTFICHSFVIYSRRGFFMQPCPFQKTKRWLFQKSVWAWLTSVSLMPCLWVHAAGSGLAGRFHAARQNCCQELAAFGRGWAELPVKARVPAAALGLPVSLATACASWAKGVAAVRSDSFPQAACFAAAAAQCVVFTKVTLLPASLFPVSQKERWPIS